MTDKERKRMQVTEIVSGDLKGERPQVLLEVDGSWPEGWAFAAENGRITHAFRHVGEGRYADLPVDMVHDEHFIGGRPSDRPVGPDDPWPSEIIVERWEDNLAGERRLLARRSYRPVPIDQVIELRPLEKPYLAADRR